jgi:transposase
MRPHGNPALLEYRRELAARLSEAGHDSGEIAEVLEADVRSVQRWLRAVRLDPASLAAQAHPGPPPRLSDAQTRRVLSWLDHDATEFGFANAWWTAPRLASVLRREMGVAMNPRYLNDWARRHGVTPQAPHRVPRERDQALIDGWVRHQWPRIKKRRGI